MKKIEFFGNKNILSQRLAAARKAKGLTQQDVASQMQAMGINIDQQMVSKIEKNLRMVTDYEFAALCQILKIEPKELLPLFQEIREKNEAPGE